jgi:hypothetical protein
VGLGSNFTNFKPSLGIRGAADACQLPARIALTVCLIGKLFQQGDMLGSLYQGNPDTFC